MTDADDRTLPPVRVDREQLWANLMQLKEIGVAPSADRFGHRSC